ncbi:MAG: CstA-like transporter-associated (seleno)protein, partial [Methylobacter sp.]
MLRILKSLWQAVRRLSGDDAYEQYLKHFDEHHQAHPDNNMRHTPLSKE